MFENHWPAIKHICFIIYLNWSIHFACPSFKCSTFHLLLFISRFSSHVIFSEHVSVAIEMESCNMSGILISFLFIFACVLFIRYVFWVILIYSDSALVSELGSYFFMFSSRWWELMFKRVKIILIDMMHILLKTLLFFIWLLVQNRTSWVLITVISVYNRNSFAQCHIENNPVYSSLLSTD